MDALEKDAFSYADPGDPPLKRFVIHLVERATGQPYLRWLYDCYREHPVPGENLWDATVRLLELKLSYDAAKLEGWPKSGPLVVVCNHPFGVLDGLVACHIVQRARPDFRVLTNAVISRAEEVRQYLLPIDFSETEAAKKTNLKSRNDAKAHVASGGCLLIFPSGAVSTTPKWWSRRAVDSEWKTFTAGILTRTRAPVAPLYFAGQNSRLFQLVSHISLTLRLSLLFYEMHNKIGATVPVVVGDAVPFEVFGGDGNRLAMMQRLRDMTYALGADLDDPPKTRLKRPRYAPPPGTPVPGLA